MHQVQKLRKSLAAVIPLLARNAEKQINGEMDHGLHANGSHVQLKVTKSLATAAAEHLGGVSLFHLTLPSKIRTRRYLGRRSGGGMARAVLELPPLPPP